MLVGRLHGTTVVSEELLRICLQIPSTARRQCAACGVHEVEQMGKVYHAQSMKPP